MVEMTNLKLHKGSPVEYRAKGFGRYLKRGMRGIVVDFLGFGGWVRVEFRGIVKVVNFQEIKAVR